MSKLEEIFQRDLIKELRVLLPGCEIFVLDPHMQQGHPDLVIVYGRKWAALECKAHEKAIRQPNQEFFIDKMRAWSYASFIYPENKEVVLREVQQALRD